MAEKFNMDWARSVIDSGMEQAKGFVENPEQMNGLLHHRRFPEIYRKKLLPSWRQFVKDVRALDEAGDPSQKPG